MKTIEIPTMTKDEINMLDGLSGQMSDLRQACINFYGHSFF